MERVKNWAASIISIGCAGKQQNLIKNSLQTHGAGSKSSFASGKGYFALAKSATLFKNVINTLNANLTPEI